MMGTINRTAKTAIVMTRIQNVLLRRNFGQE
jgi:hypothetical protein